MLESPDKGFIEPQSYTNGLENLFCHCKSFVRSIVCLLPITIPTTLSVESAVALNHVWQLAIHLIQIEVHIAVEIDGGKANATVIAQFDQQLRGCICDSHC
jgi:hypothetical protein